MIGISRTVLVVDDHHLVRDGIVRFVRSHDQSLRPIEAGSLREAVGQMRMHAPVSLVLLDLNLPDSKGTASVAALREVDPHVPILVVTGSESDEIEAGLAAESISGFLSKSVAPWELNEALGTVLEGGRYNARSANGHRTAGAAAGSAEPNGRADGGVGRAGGNGTGAVFGEDDPCLSPRQCAVLELICAGCSNKEIARRLDMSDKTVKNHLTAVFAKLRVVNRTQAALVARERGVLPRCGVAAFSASTTAAGPHIARESGRTARRD